MVKSDRWIFWYKDELVSTINILFVMNHKLTITCAEKIYIKLDDNIVIAVLAFTGLFEF